MRALCPQGFPWLFPALLLFLSCAVPPPSPEQSPRQEAKLDIFDNGLKAVLTLPQEASIRQSILDTLSSGVSYSILNQWIPSSMDNSLKSNVIKTALERLQPHAFQYIISNTEYPDKNAVIEFEIDTSRIIQVIDHIVQSYRRLQDVPIEPLFSNNGNPPAFKVVESLSLSLPCKDFPVPNQANLLPNAPRKYRNGIHRGIDFWVDWGTAVKSVAKGTVIRADHGFAEIPAEFRVKLLKTAHKTGHTPSDIFNHILLGQAVFIDHGFNLVPGYRSVSIYAHLSHINADVKPGTFIDKGQQIGLSGNSGIKDATEGKRTGAHLHWELILQDANGEYYLGQGFPCDSLYPFLMNIFQ